MGYMWGNRWTEFEGEPPPKITEYNLEELMQIVQYAADEQGLVMIFGVFGKSPNPEESFITVEQIAVIVNEPIESIKKNKEAQKFIIYRKPNEKDKRRKPTDYYMPEVVKLWGVS